MSIWKWDPFEEFLGQAPLQAENNEFNLTNDFELKLMRDSDHKIKLDASGPARDIREKKQPPLGTIYRTDNEILLKSVLGNISLQSVHHTNSITNISQHSTTTDTFSIEKILFTADTNRLAEYTVEHIGNLPNHYSWPDCNDFSSKTNNLLKFGALPDLDITTTAGRRSTSYNCLHIKINDETIIIGETKNVRNVKNAGYVFYLGHPSDKLRRLIRDALSFALGRPIIYFGHTSLTLSGSIISLEAITPQTMDGRAWQSESPLVS